MRVFPDPCACLVSVASAETLACLTTFQGYRVCQGPDGYRSIEIEWMALRPARTIAVTTGPRRPGTGSRRPRSGGGLNARSASRMMTDV
jgi:hypothetical protein